MLFNVIEKNLMPIVFDFQIQFTLIIPFQYYCNSEEQNFSIFIANCRTKIAVKLLKNNINISPMQKCSFTTHTPTLTHRHTHVNEQNSNAKKDTRSN